MFLNRVVVHCVVAVLVTGALAGCSSLREKFSDKRVEYKKSQTLPPLEIPPDLGGAARDDEMPIPEAGTGPARTSFSDYSSAAIREERTRSLGVLPAQQDIKVERDGDTRWLLIRGEPDQVWQKVHDFWLERGFLLKVDDPRVGIMETDWAENRADIPQGPIRNFLGRVLDSVYSAPTRDRFRVRLERGQAPGTTELFLSHQGVEEVVQGDTTVWQARPSDPELEAEMLNRLMVYLGVEERKAKAQLAQAAHQGERAQLVKGTGGDLSLVIDEDFSRAWRRTGLALDRVAFTVEDRDRSRGVYYVRYNDPLKGEGEKKGLLSKLAFWKSDEPTTGDRYQISLDQQADKTVAVVLDKEGKRDNSSTAQRILTLIYEQLK